MAERPFTTEVEVPFETKELFFSRTDDRGVIRAGNTVFQRISGFEWDELIGAPHKMVRHPDMPRAVFWVMWDRLKRGLPVGAYVKNRSKTGGYYWVYAMITPCDGGYLSVRMRPTTNMLDKVVAAYDRVRALEEDGLAPEDSFQELAQDLADLGYRDYGAFMAHSLVQEATSRDRELGRTPQFDADGMLELLDASADVLDEAKEVIQHFHRIRSFPVNLRIQSQKISKIAKIFAEVSDDYERFCKKIQSQVSLFVDGSADVSEQIADATFRFVLSFFQAEMAKVFEAEAARSDDLTLQQEIDILNKQAKDFYARTAQSLAETDRNVRAFQKTSKDVTWLVNGLDLARTLGMVETARLSEHENTLHKMMDEAATFQARILEHLDKLTTLNGGMIDRTERLVAAM